MRCEMSELNECQICELVSADRSELCSPREVEAQARSGVTLHDKVAAMCETARQSVHFSCRNCGRPATDAELVCSPRVLDV